MAKQDQAAISKSFSEALQGSAEKSYAQAVKTLSAKNLEKTAVTAMADKNPNISPREFKANITALINEVHAANIKKAEKSGDALAIKNATTKRDVDIDLFKDTLKSPEFKKKVSEAKGTLNGYLESIVGKDATKRLNDVKYATGPLDAVWVATTGSIQAGAHVIGTVALSQMKDLQAGLSGGVFAMTKSMTSGITNAISKSMPIVGGLLGGFVDLFIDSAKILFDWSITQNKNALRGAAVTGGKEGSVLKLDNFSDATKIPREMASTIAAALAPVGLGGGEYNAKFNAADKSPDKIKHTATGELFNQATKYLGGDYTQAGNLAASIKQGYGVDGTEAVIRLNGFLRETEKLAFNSGINAQIFGTSMAGAAAETRFAHLGAGMLEQNMENMVKSKAALGNLGYDLQASLPEMTRTLTGLNKSISEAQAAVIGYEMAKKSGGDTGDVLGNMYRVRLGKAAFENMSVSSEGRVTAAKGANFNAGNVTADIIQTVRDKIAETIKQSGMTNKGEILKMSEGVLKTYTNLDLSSAAGAQIVAGETSASDLASNPDFKAETATTQSLAAQTLTSSQRQEALQSSIIKIVIAMSGILIGAFASITRLLLGIASRFNVKGASTEYEKIFGAKGPMQGMGISAALSNAMTTIPQAFNEMTPEMQLQYGPMFNKAIAASKSPEIAAYDQNAIDTTYHSNILNEAGVAYRENWDREVNKVATEAYNKEFAISHDEGKAQSTQNAAINEYKRSHPQEMPQVSTPTKHSGGNFNGVAKVLSNEYFTPTTHHNGGVLGDGNGSFTFDTKSLKTGEMMAFTPNNTQYKVETPDQYSKSRGAFNFDTKSLNSRANNDFASSTYQRSQESTSQYNKSNSANGPIYNMSISISGVASKSDIVHTFTRALNEAVG